MIKPYKTIKIGGNELAAPGFIQGLTAAIKEQQKEFAPILVHGGGRAIDQLMQQMQIEPQYKNGQRITDEATLEIAEMILSGKINKKLVFELSALALEAIGLSGVDRKLLQVEPWGADMHLVGRIVKVRQELLVAYCAQKVIPVISPISIGSDGRYNVNADHAAGMIAGALKAEEAVFITNVPGVLVDDNVVPQLTDTEVYALINSNTIHGGMIPKVNAALDALKFGAKSAKITDLAGFIGHTGTTIITKRKNNGSKN
ncbi:MAG: acetylglutamate kinase [Chloroflexota bacterium]